MGSVVLIYWRLCHLLPLAVRLLHFRDYNMVGPFCFRFVLLHLARPSALSRSGGISREAICVELIVLELEVLCAGVICVLFCLVAFGSVVMLICFVFLLGTVLFGRFLCVLVFCDVKRKTVL